jgi:GTP-binding protein
VKPFLTAYTTCKTAVSSSSIRANLFTKDQVIGEHSRSGDLVINVTKTKKLTNMRASGADEKMKIAPPLKHTLEEALEYIQADEYVEVTPKSIRLRKIFLNENDRKRNKAS